MTVSEYRDALDALISQLVATRDDINATVRLNDQLTAGVRAAIRTRVLTQVATASTALSELVLD